MLLAIRPFYIAHIEYIPITISCQIFNKLHLLNFSEVKQIVLFSQISSYGSVRAEQVQRSTSSTKLATRADKGQQCFTSYSAGTHSCKTWLLS